MINKGYRNEQYGKKTTNSITFLPFSSEPFVNNQRGDSGMNKTITANGDESTSTPN